MAVPAGVSLPPGTTLYATSRYARLGTPSSPRTPVLTQATLAPNGFKCAAFESQDGSTLATITTPSDSHEDLLAGYHPEPPGGTASYACAFFAAARTELQHTLGSYYEPAYCQLPSSGSVSMLPTGNSTQQAALVTVPAGAVTPVSLRLGAADRPAMSPLPTYGLVTWDSAGNLGLGATQSSTCTLPKSDNEICAASLQYFLATSDLGRKLAPAALRSALAAISSAIVGRGGSAGAPPSNGRPAVGVPPQPAIDCPLLSFSTTAGASVTAFSIKLGQDWEEELADTSAGWEVSSVHGLDLGALASFGAHLTAGGHASALLGWDVELAASLGYQHALTALYPSHDAAVDAYLQLGLYQLDHSVPGGGLFFGGLPSVVKNALISEFNGGGVIADAEGSLGLVGGDASLTALSGQETDPLTGDSAYEFILKPAVSLPGLAANVAVQLKVIDNSQRQATALELDTEGFVSPGFTFSTAGLLEQLAPQTSGSASKYGASADVTDTRIILDLRSQATQTAGRSFVASLQHGNVGGAVDAWNQLTKQATVYSFISHVQSDSSGADLSGGAGLTFGGGADVDSERAVLIHGAFQSPGSAGPRLWNACVALAARASYENPAGNG